MSKKLTAFIVSIVAILTVAIWGIPESAGQACLAIGIASSAYTGTQAGIDAVKKFKENGTI